MLKELNNYDWENVFTYTHTPDAGPPGSDVKVTGFEREDVAAIIAMQDGENDGAEWLGAFVLKDGRFVAVRAGCDYTGWDCQAGGNADVAATYDDLLRFCLSEAERLRLGLPADLGQGVVTHYLLMEDNGGNEELPKMLLQGPYRQDFKKLWVEFFTVRNKPVKIARTHEYRDQFIDWLVTKGFSKVPFTIVDPRFNCEHHLVKLVTSA